MTKRQVQVRFAATLFMAVVATVARAQTIVGDEASLNNAIAGAEGETISIRLGTDITLSAYLKIGESKEQTVILDLCGHKLRRNLDEVDDNGHVIEVFDKGVLTVKDSWKGGEISGGRANNGGGICNYGTLHLDGGTITNCSADVSGGGVRNNGVMTMGGGTILGCWGRDCGGIYNAAGATLTITGGTISGNTSNAGGGGVVNYGTATISGGTIHNNHATTRGGGIWNGGTMTISRVTVIGNRADIEGGGVWHGGSLTMAGAVKITDNENAHVPDNLFLVQGKVFNVGGAFTDEARIGVGMENPGVFTNGYRTHNSNTNHFFPDAICDVTVNADGEACLSLNKRKYYECSWDEANKRVVSTVKEIPPITVDNICTTKYSNGGDLWGDYYWFIADGTANINGSLTCQGKDVHLILCDGASLSLKGLFISQNSTLHIYCQSYAGRMGKLISQVDGVNGDYESIPAIGYRDRNVPTHGPVIIHGGSVYAKGGGMAAGIGGPYKATGVSLTIYGGVIEAYGGPGDYSTKVNRGGAGIGGGFQGNGGTLTVYNGEVYAHGGKQSSGIGSGDCESSTESKVYDIHGGFVNIYGGTVKAWGDESAAGIGGGEYANGATVNISGGAVYAEGGKYAAGIGGGSNCDRGATTISGGYVYAKGGSEGAGIGSGEKMISSVDYPCGPITITGGKVEAFGGDFGAGIGGGQNYDGGPISISGGEVYAHGGDDAAGIGSGEEGVLRYNIDGGVITISGGFVFAEGKGYGAGIGGGEKAAMGNITISGGTVHAYAGLDSKAIHSDDMTNGANSVAIGDKMMVSVGVLPGLTSTVITSEYLDIRGYSTQNYSYACIEPCAHSGADYTITDAIKHQLNNCHFCLRGGSSENHAFIDDSKCACGLLGLKDNADNTAALARWNNTTQTVALIGRTLYKDNKWNTLCLPFSVNYLVDIPFEGAEVKTLQNSAFSPTDMKLTLNFSDATFIEAGKPYIVKWTEGEDAVNPIFWNVRISDVTPAVETEVADFQGIFSPWIIGGASSSMLYLGDDNQLYHPFATMQINAFRAYFLLHDGLVANMGDGSINEFELNFGNDATGMENIQPSILNPHSEAWYSLDGRKFSDKPTAKGVYIFNGKKVVIK